MMPRTKPETRNPGVPCKPKPYPKPEMKSRCSSSKSWSIKGGQRGKTLLDLQGGVENHKCFEAQDQRYS